MRVRNPIAMALTKEGSPVAIIWVSADGTRSLTVAEDGSTALASSLTLRITDPLPRIAETEREDEERRRAFSGCTRSDGP